MIDNPSFEESIAAYQGVAVPFDVVDYLKRIAASFDIPPVPGPGIWFYSGGQWVRGKSDVHIYGNRDIKAKLIAKYWRRCANRHR